MTLVTSLLPPAVVIVESKIGDDDETFLATSEAACIAGAGPKRRREFAAGRRLAREVLTRLGVARSAMPQDDDGLPIWPSGIVGSITHSDRDCAVAAARGCDMVGLGIDIESVARFRPQLERHILSPAEIAACLDTAPDGERQHRAAACFCAKEAFYKCVFPLSRRQITFLDAVIDLDPDGTFHIRLLVAADPFPAGRVFNGRYASDGDTVAAALWIERGSAADIGS